MNTVDRHPATRSLPDHLRRRIHWRIIRSSRIHLCLLGLCLIGGAAGVILLILDRSLAFAIVALLVTVLMYPLELMGHRRRLATALLKLGIRPSHCGSCEYDLRATKGESCPECGTRIAPRTTADQGEDARPR